MRRGSSNSSLKQLKQLTNKIIPIQLSIEVRSDSFFASVSRVDIFIEFDLIKDTREEVVRELMQELSVEDTELKNSLCSELKQILTEKDLVSWS